MVDVVGTIRYANQVPDAKLRSLLEGVALASETDIQERTRAVYGKELFYAATEARVFDYQKRRPNATHSTLPVARSCAPYRRHTSGSLASDLQAPRLLANAAVGADVHRVRVRVPTRLGSTRALRSSFVRTGWIDRSVEWLSETFVFRAYFYFALTLALLPFAIIRRQRVAAVVLASGFAYELAMCYRATRIEFGDSFWLLAATVLAIVMLVARPRNLVDTCSPARADSRP